MRPENPKNKKDILKLAIPLFARGGYSGVSMRQIAKKVGLNAASLYHYFPDKQTLYIEAVKQAFPAKELDLSKTLIMKASVHKKLHQFVERSCTSLKMGLNFMRSWVRVYLEL